jgi:hypothetical protein
MSRAWFWKPSWYWYGWTTLIPFVYGHDEYARRTIMLGWTVTGRVIIALWPCGDRECEEDAAKRKIIARRAKRAWAAAK